jgi:hypothetical protein
VIVPEHRLPGKAIKSLNLEQLHFHQALGFYSILNAMATSCDRSFAIFTGSEENTFPWIQKTVMKIRLVTCAKLRDYCSDDFC